MKCFEEIEENIGLNRPPSMKDKTSLPYLEATIHETLRHADIVPASVPHSVSEDVDFQGYLIPKGTTIITMLDSVLQDPEIWGDPENFRPKRFLDDNGKFQRKEEFVPFSIGMWIEISNFISFQISNIPSHIFTIIFDISNIY